MGLITTSTSTLIYSGPIPDLLPMTDRAPGIHISHIIHDLALRLGYYKDNGGDMPWSKMALGSALEHAIAMRLMLHEPGRYYREWDDEHGYWKNGMALERDGVHMNLDLLDLHDWAVEDVKLTWLSSSHDPDGPKFNKWWWQVMGYSYGVGAEIGRIRVGHVRGDYKNNEVDYHVWERRFVPGELERNWTMLMKHKQIMEKEGKL